MCVGLGHFKNRNEANCCNHRAAVVPRSLQPVLGVREKGGVIPPRKRWQRMVVVWGSNPGFSAKHKGVQVQNVFGLNLFLVFDIGLFSFMFGFIPGWL